MFFSLNRREQTEEPVSEAMCVLYNPTDGRILHFHRVSVLPGARVPSREDVERLAIETARRHHDTAELRPLHVTRAEFHHQAGRQYRVDIRRRRIVEVREPQRRLSRERPIHAPQKTKQK